MWTLCQVGKYPAVFVATLLCAGLLVQGAGAQTASATCDPAKLGPNASCKVSTSSTAVDPSGNVKTVNKQESVTPPYGETNWQGLNWGIGIAADFDLGGSRVSKVQFDSANIVRVTDTSGNVGVSFVLEAHYFIKDWEIPLIIGGCSPKYQGASLFPCTDAAIGPFVAIEIGGGATATPNSGPITGSALGLMLGMHHPTANSADPKLANSTWNFGVGLRVDPSAQVLADGVVANRPPPAGITTTDLLVKKEPRYGLMLLSSFSF